MTSWILILTIYSGVSGTMGLTAVHGLEDERSCKNAGIMFVNNKNLLMKKTYMCVPTKAEK